MIKVIIINGAGTSGKDTFIDLFTEVCHENNGYPVYRFSSVDEVKHFATILGWDGVKDDKGRRFLSDIKDALTLYSDAPYKYMEQKVKEVSEQEDNAFIFFHIREPKEIHKMVERLGAETVLIRRQGVEAFDFTNHADKNVGSYNYDFYVNNFGSLEELKKQAVIYLGYLLKKQEVSLDARSEAELQAT